jgi:hypothetical protein
MGRTCGQHGGYEKENVKIKENFGYPDVDGDNINIHFKGVGVLMDSSVSGYDLAAGSCEHGNEPSSFITCREFLDQLSDYQNLEKNSASYS